MRTPAHLAANARGQRAQAGQFGERDSKVDVGSAIGQPVDFEWTRPGRRHGARIIGSDPFQVKVGFGAKPLFSRVQPPLILASTSAYRRELLLRLRLPFEALPPRVAEGRVNGESPADRALRLAYEKAQAIASAHPDAIVIGSDQVAQAGERQLDKPGDAQRCSEQLALLSGGTAHFYTACAVVSVNAGIRQAHVDTTTVLLRTLSADEIERYVASERPFDCAGGFKAEGAGIALFERIESQDPTALIGLPLIWLAGALRAVGLPVP
jgi:septum formation protein